MCTNKPKDAQSDTGKGVADADTTEAFSLAIAFFEALKAGNLHPTLTHIKGHLAAAGNIVHDEKINNLLLRIENKGLQELCAYLYEVKHSLPPATGHQYFTYLDKERRHFLPKDTHECLPKSSSCRSTSLVAEKDAFPVAKRLKTGSIKPKPYLTARCMVHSAYFKATHMKKIKHPTVADIKGLLEDFRRRIPDAVSVPDEEIENIMSEIRSSGLYDGLAERYN